MASKKIPTEVDCPVDHTDPVTGKQCVGTFTFRVSLSAADSAAVGRRRRQILGGSPAVSEADQVDHMFAHYQAEISVRAIAPVPEFWAKQQGDDLSRDALSHIAERMNAKLLEVVEMVRAATEEAKGDIQRAVRGA